MSSHLWDVDPFFYFCATRSNSYYFCYGVPTCNPSHCDYLPRWLILIVNLKQIGITCQGSLSLGLSISDWPLDVSVEIVLITLNEDRRSSIKVADTIAQFRTMTCVTGVGKPTWVPSMHVISFCSWLWCDKLLQSPAAVTSL